MRYKSLFLLLPILLLFACNKEAAVAPPDASKGTYFSVKQFAKDQWETFAGQPFGLTKTVYLNGKKDSSFTNAYDMDWGVILKTFFESDISDPKFLDQYKFTEFDDDVTYTKNFYYEAINDKLYTRKLQISADNVSHKIRSIYIETAKNEQWHKKSQRLFYQPLKIISIQEFEWSKTAPDKELRIEYRFL